MGTRSRIILHRTTKPNIYLWMHWDGYFTGQGKNLCVQLKSLLSRYTLEELQVMVENLEVSNIESGDYQSFSAEHFGDFMEGKQTFKQDLCDDIEYEYHIDFHKEPLVRIEALNYEMTFYITKTIMKGDYGRILAEYEEITRMSDRLNHMQCAPNFTIKV
jgi:hypothetical protein